MKRSIVRSGHKTSIFEDATLEDEFWEGLQAIAKKQGKTISQLIVKIDEHSLANLSSAIRMYVLRHYRDEWLDNKHSTH
jgi:predicted DNA-binding ribbon-helix-helix protein